MAKSETDQDEWISAAQALSLIAGGYNHINNARRAIVEHAKAGLVDAKARRKGYASRHGSLDPNPIDDALLPADFWGGVDPASYESDWTAGSFVQVVARGIGVAEVRAFGVEFKRSQILALWPRTQSAPAIVESGGSSNRGRPKRDIWEPMWAEITAKAMKGELSTSRQADVEAAMHDHFTEIEKPPSESTVRTRAQMLWAALSRKADK